MADQKQISLSGRSLFVAIPTYDGKLNIKTAFNLAQLTAIAGQHGISVMFAHISGCSIITVARNALVHKFLDTDCTDLLFLDADVIATADDVMRLLAQSTNKDIAAGLYPRRAMDKNFFVDIPHDEEGNMIFDGSMLKVNRIGTGFMMIKRYVLEKLIADHPEWEYETKPDEGNKAFAVFDFANVNGKYTGEDYLFCDRAREAGFEVWVDVEISLPHVGTEEFTRNFVEDVIRPLIRNQQVAHLKAA
jgi:hypothetical protein